MLFAVDVKLTVREQDVVHLVANGLSAKEAAIKLDIAPRTVERHIENCRLKLRARNRTHLIAMCIAGGLLDQADQTDQAA